MPVFVVIPDKPDALARSPALRQFIATGDAYRVSTSTWAVSYAGTTKDLSDVLGISEGTPSDGVVFSITSYWGRATKDVWEWLSGKMV